MDASRREREEDIKKELEAAAGIIKGVFKYGKKQWRGEKPYEISLRYIDLLIDESQYKPDEIRDWKKENKKSLRNRLKTDLEAEGLIYYALTFEGAGKREMLFMHPTTLYEIGKESLKGATPTDEAERGHKVLRRVWETKMEKQFKKEWLSPVEGWFSEIAYANVIGWINYLDREMEDGRALFLTPHLSLLKSDFLKNSLKKAAEEYNLTIEFLCFQESLSETCPEKSFTFHIIDKDAPWAERLRALIFENKEGEPVFAFEALKQPKRGRYVGTLYCGMREELLDIKRSIEKFKEDYEEVIVPKFPEEV